MTTRPWYRSAALVLALPMIIIVTAYDLAWWFSDSSAQGSGYMVSAVAQAQPALSLGYVFVAVSGAASGLAFRRTGLSEVPSSRSRARVVLTHLAPTLVLGLLCWGVCVLISVLYTENLRLTAEPLPLIATQFLGVLAWAALGFALGASRLGAASLAAVPFLCFFVFGFFESLPARFGSALNGGDFSYCCGSAETVATGALLATALFFTGLLLCAVALLAERRRTGGMTRAVASAIAVVITVVAIVVGSSTPYPALTARRGDPPCATASGTTVCLWPEQVATVPDSAEEIARLASALRERGVEVPDRVSGDLADPAALHFPRSPTTAEGARTLLVMALASTDGACGPFDEHASPDLLSGYSVLTAWLYVAGGLDEDPILDSLSEAESETWRELSQLPDEDQAAWVNAYLTALTSCSPSAPALPGGTR